jgi:hypothetical protein
VRAKLQPRGQLVDRVEAASTLFAATNISSFALLHQAVANEVAEVSAKLKRVSLDAEQAVLEVRAKSLKTELIAKRVEKDLLIRTTEVRKREMSGGRARMRELRGADIAKPARLAKP